MHYRSINDMKLVFIVNNKITSLELKVIHLGNQ